MHVLQTLPSLSSEGLPADRVRDFACSIFPSPAPEPLNSALPSLAPPVPLNPFRNVSYEPFPVDPSHPSMFASPFCLDSTPTLTPYPTPQHQSPPHPQPNPPPPAKPPSQPPISSRFAHPNRFQALSTTSESIASHISWSVPVVTLEIPPAPHSPSFPAQHNPQHQAQIRHTILQQDKTKTPAPVNVSFSSSSLSTTAPSPPSPLIADTGCTGVLLQLCNFPSLRPFFSPKPLPCLPFTLPDRSILSVGGPSHITGELSFPHKVSPISCYFLPDSALSHSLVGISPLLRPNGHALFTNTSVFLFDTPTSSLPFLTGTKAPSSDLWFFTVPPAPIPRSLTNTALPTLESLPHARFVSYLHRCFGSPSLSSFLRALSRGYIHGIPLLTHTLVRKFPPYL